jgi:hypothetical protein
MKSLLLRKFVILAMLFITASTVSAFPRDPDNAALLYYQAFLSFPKDYDQMPGAMEAVVDGTAEPDDVVRGYLAKYQTSIKLALAASDLDVCDWGMRYSEGFDAIMAHLGQMRSLSRVMATQAQILLHDGQVREGLKYYLAMRKMAWHTGDDLIISYLVRVSIKTMADKGLRQALCRESLDQETLTWLKQQLVTGPDLPGKVRKALQIEEEIAVGQMSLGKDRLVAMLIKDNPDLSADHLARLKSVGEPFYAANRAYYQQQMQRMFELLDSSDAYAQKHQGFVQLIQQVQADSQQKEEAILTGLELFMIKARTGAFPDQLPGSAALDLFSGKAFQYIKGGNGFTLRCQAEDLDKNTVYEYAYTVQ